MLNHNNMPGAGSITDTMEFMRKMWGGMGAPSMGIPTLSVEEINKKITDLKAVESWLELNMNMLRATIQTLEVQSATLSALQSMGAILTPQPQPQAQSSSAGVPPFDFSAWSMASQPAAAAEKVDEVEEAPLEPPAATEAAAEESADIAAAMVNPNAWWNLLQDQFQQAVGKVLADQGAAPPPAPDATPQQTTSAKAVAKPRTRAKSSAVQSEHPKSSSRKTKSP